MALTERFIASSEAQKHCETTATLGSKIKKDGIYHIQPINGYEYGETEFTNDEGKKFVKKCLFMDCGSLLYDTLVRTRYDETHEERHPMGTVYDFISNNFTLGETLISDIFKALINRMGTAGIKCVGRDVYKSESDYNFTIFSFDFVESDEEYQKRIEKQSK